MGVQVCQVYFRANWEIVFGVFLTPEEFNPSYKLDNSSLQPPLLPEPNFLLLPHTLERKLILLNLLLQIGNNAIHNLDQLVRVRERFRGRLRLRGGLGGDFYFYFDFG